MSATLAHVVTYEDGGKEDTRLCVSVLLPSLWSLFL